MFSQYGFPWNFVDKIYLIARPLLRELFMNGLATFTKHIHVNITDRLVLIFSTHYVGRDYEEGR